ncbi:uncharacterized protein LOC119007325 isoform X2 [Acanthopagrus latus]|uniref:uncharacterized protein LOC119007325 isoform X2 n=1 Tax=Acanthopagrus latus TaxID=8177 RepID=UPI00187CA330|nr:uncharacterized protein LOC119007325 isoform X2 [Acanthopagrus latus]
MSYNLRKFEFKRRANATRPKASSPSDSPSRCGTPEPEDQMEPASLKAEILTELKMDIAMPLRSELKAALAEDFQNIKAELQAVRTELANNTAAIRADVETMKTTVAHMEQGLSSCSDDVTSLLTKVGKLETEVGNLQKKCLDMEGRMRRSNIRILNVPETPESSTPTAVSKLLKEALKLDKDVLIDRSHRGLQPRSQDGRPRVIVAKVHYYQDCADILRRARESGPLRFRGTDISIFPDYPPSVVQARSAFSEVKTGFPPRVRSLPNIPSILIDQDFGSDFLKTSKSENRSIHFKEGQLKDQFQILESILDDLERCRKSTVRNLDKTSSLPGLNIHLHQPQQHQFEEDIEVELHEDIVLEIPIQVESSPQQQLFEEDSDDDLYSTRVSEVPVPVQLSPQQQLDEDSDDDLYSNRVSEVQVPVQSSPWFEDEINDDLYGYRFRVPVFSSPPVHVSVHWQPLEEDSDDDLYSTRVSEVPVPVQSSPQFEDEIEDDLYDYSIPELELSSTSSHQFEEDIVCELSEEMDLEIPTRVLSSSQFEDEIEDDLYDYSIPELELSSTSSHQFEEDIVCELSEEMDLEIPTRVLSSSQFEDEIEDDLYDYSIPELELSSTSSHQFEEDIVCELSEEMDLEIPTRVLSSSQQQLDEDSDDDLYSNRVSEVQVPVQSSPWVRIRGLFQRIQQFMNDFGRLLSRV